MSKVIEDNVELNNTVGKLTKDNIKYARDNKILMDAASEGMFEESIATVTRKINFVTDRLAVMANRINSTPNSKDVLSSYEYYNTKLSILSEKRRGFVEAQNVYQVLIDEYSETDA